MNVIRHRFDAQRIAVYLSKNSNEDTIQFIAQFSVFEKWVSIFGAEDDVK